MKIRIIAGKYGGRLIDAPTTTRTHPMGERIRNALFNTIGSEINGSKVLDAFAGSGAIGLEAISRGAKEAIFVEKDRVAQKVLNDNCELLDVAEKAQIIRSSVSAWLDTRSTSDRYDIIFVDPPYHNTQQATVMRLFELLLPGGLLVLSHPEHLSLSIEDISVALIEDRNYGNAYLAYFRKHT